MKTREPTESIDYASVPLARLLELTFNKEPVDPLTLELALRLEMFAEMVGGLEPETDVDVEGVPV